MSLFLSTKKIDRQGIIFNWQHESYRFNAFNGVVRCKSIFKKKTQVKTTGYKFNVAVWEQMWQHVKIM